MARTYIVTCDWCGETRPATISEWWNLAGKTFLSQACRDAYKAANGGSVYRARPVPDSDGDAEPDAAAVRNAERAARGV